MISGETIPRQRLALVLDTADLKQAKQLAKKLSPYFGVLKVGLTLFSAHGPKAVKALKPFGQIFLDLKLHDIPNQVEGAARAISKLGVDYVTLHAEGGKEMLTRAVRALDENLSGENLASATTITASSVPIPKSAAKSNDPSFFAPQGVKTLAITFLTSQGNVDENVFKQRVKLAAEAGCYGIVCSAHEVKLAKEVASSISRDIFCVVPGIRQAGNPTHDQARAATLSEAKAAGADMFVIGRAVTEASDPIEAAKSLLEI